MKTHIALLALALAGCGTAPITDAEGTRASAILDPRRGCFTNRARGPVAP